MAFPRRLLSEGEEIVLDLRPHPIALVFPLLITVLAVALIIMGLTLVRGVSRWIAVILALGGFVILALPKYVAWATAHFVVTSERIIHRTGLVSKHAMDIPLDRLQNVKFSQGVFERIIGAGDLTLESAGETGVTRFEDVRNPERVQKTIYEVRELDERNRLHPDLPDAGPAPVADELHKLEQLRQQGVISDAEFASRKSRLLES